MPATITQLSKDTTFSTAVAVDKLKATCAFAVSPSEKLKAEGIRYGLTDVVLDFTGVSQDELIELAAKPIIIDLQRVFRVGYAADKKYTEKAADWNVKSVRELIDTAGTRGPVDPKARVLSGFAKMDAVERRAMLAQLEASVAAEDKAAKAAAKAAGKKTA